MTCFCLIFALIVCFGVISPNISLSSALEIGGSAKVIVSNSYLYTESNFSSEKVSFDEQENTILVTLEYGDIVNIQNFEGDFAYVSTENEKEGYIYKFYISDNTSQAVYPVFNASVRKNTIVYDIEKKATSHTIKKDSRIYLYKGFNDKNKYTPVQVVLEDESLYNGYILTENIKPDGVSGILIVGISVIIAAVTIILSIVFMKKKKKKKTD